MAGWWITGYNLEEVWNTTKGENVRVAVLDTGINRHVDFDFSKIQGYDYINKSADFTTDENGHGTHCTGIINANGTKNQGMAPDANLFIAKVCDAAGKVNFDALKSALDDIYNETNNAGQVDILSMSFVMVGSIDEQPKIKEIEVLLTKIATDKKCILVSASGDRNEDWNNSPASVSACICVGSVGQTRVRSVFSTKTINMDVMAPGEDILSSANTQDSVAMSGTSMSAAYISGICALGLSYIKARMNEDPELIKKILYQTADAVNSSVNEYGHGIVAPQKFIDTLKTI
ncbi:MAG: thermitase [Bacteroidetes bacterium]|nr:thermitase [Bacteroidota bacterium]